MNLKTKIELFSSIVLGIVGITCLMAPQFNAEILFYVCAWITSLSAIALWVEANYKKRGLDYLEAGLATILAVILWMHQQEGYELVVIFFGVFMLVNAAGFLIQCILDLRDQSKTILYNTIQFFVYLILGIWTLLHKQQSLSYIQYFIGAYLLIQVFQIWAQLILFSKETTSRFYSFKLWSSLPLAIVSILPFLYLEGAVHSKLVKNPKDFSKVKNDTPVNLKVYIHTGLKGDHRFGHMTLAYKDIMYSYGNYDKENEHLFRTIGPGVFFSVDAKEYINNSCIYEDSTLFEYGLHLNDEQEKKLADYLSSVFEETYPWSCMYEEKLKEDSEVSFSQYESDYASRLWYRTKCRFRKFYEGEWKTYWVLGTNCSLFASDILHKVDPYIHKSHGIVTPGEYWEYFEEALKDPKSNVISKTWYSALMPQTLFSLPPQSMNNLKISAKKDEISQISDR